MRRLPHSHVQWLFSTLVDLSEPTTSRPPRRASSINLPARTPPHDKLSMGKATASEEGMSQMDKGRHRYAKGDYAEALTAFTEVRTPPSCYAPGPFRFCSSIMTPDRLAIFGGSLSPIPFDFDHFTIFCSGHINDVSLLDGSINSPVRLRTPLLNIFCLMLSTLEQQRTRSLATCNLHFEMLRR